MFLTLTVLRHAQTDGNVGGLCLGITDTPLNNDGRIQAKLAGKRLQNEIFDFVYASNLTRAAETASIIVKQNLNTDSGYDKVVKLPVLCEKTCGILDGQPVAELAKEAKMVGIDTLEYTPKGGETLISVQNRAARFMEMISKMKPSTKKNDLNVLVVTHQMFIAPLIGYLYGEINCDGIPAENIKMTHENTLLFKGEIPNTSINKFDIEVDSIGEKINSCNCSLFVSSEHIQ